MLKTEVEKQRKFQRQLHQNDEEGRQSTLLLYHFLRVYGIIDLRFLHQHAAYLHKRVPFTVGKGGIWQPGRSPDAYGGP